jgi:hypothetical protein
MQSVQVATFVNADLEIRKRRQDAKPETMRVMAAVSAAKDAAMGAMVAAGRSVIRVNATTWVVMAEKRGAFPKLSVDALTETLKCMDPVKYDGGAGGNGAGNSAGGVREFVRKSLSCRGEGCASLVVQCYPPPGHVEDVAGGSGAGGEVADADDADGCVCAAAAYVDALSCRNVHMDRLRVECAPAVSRRSDTESAVIEYVAPNGGDVGAPVYRRVACSVTGAQLYIKVEFRQRKRSVSRAAFMQLVDAELRIQLSAEKAADDVASDSWLAELRLKIEKTLGAFVDAGGVPEMSARVSVSESPPPCMRQ